MNSIFCFISLIISFITSKKLTDYLIVKYPEYKMDKKYLSIIGILSIVFGAFIQYRLINIEMFANLNIFFQIIVIFMMAILAGVVSSSFIIDCLFRELPDENNFIIGLMIFPISLYLFGYKVIFTAIILFVVFFMFAILTGQLGMGDVKMMFFMGLGFLPSKIVSFIFITFFVASLFGIFKLIKTKFEKNQTIAFGPFLIIGFILTIL